MGLQEDHSARQPIFRAPGVVVALIGLLALAHAARVWAPAPWPDEIAGDYALTPLAYLTGGDWFHRLVPPFSHMLLHASWTHLVINCVWLLAFGPVVARRFGGVPFLIFFALCGVAGAAFFVAMDWGVAVGAVGASGAISGLMGAAIRMMDSGFASAEDIDTGMVLGCAHPMGPLALADLIGLDTIKAIADSMYEEFKEPLYFAPPLLLRMVDAGLLGKKSGRGFHTYDTK